MSKATQAVVAPERIETRIFLARGQKVMLSTHLAELYEVEPRALVQAVKRNIERFPEDFRFLPPVCRPSHGPSPAHGRG